MHLGRYIDFERARKWLEGDKIEILANKTAVSDPLYHDSFQYIIDNAKHGRSRIRDIGKILSKLAYENKTTGQEADAIATYAVVMRIINNLDKIPFDIHQPLEVSIR
jgi:hypothetical protein